MTKQRAIMLSIFRSEACHGKHKTAAALLVLAKELMPAISRATVYNNLRAMEEEGLIRRITGDNGADVYDASFDLHAHLICTVCNEIKDVPCPDMLDMMRAASGENIDSYELKLRYVCEKCKAAV